MKHYFRHFRLFNNRGEVMPKGGVTVYVQYFPSVANEECTDVEVSTAVCSYKDHYNKKLGRRIAQGRKYHPDNTIIPLDSYNQDISNDLYEIAFNALEKVKFKGGFHKIGLICKHSLQNRTDPIVSKMLEKHVPRGY